MSKPERTAQLFLERLSTDSGSGSIIDSLKKLIEDLENKSDPDPIEIKLLENLYHFLENLTIINNNVLSYVKNSRQNLSGTKLMSLYEDNTHNIFEY